MKSTSKNFLLLFLLITIGCNTKDESPAPDPTDDTVNMTDDGTDGPTLTIVNAFPQLTFSRPVDFQAPDDGTNRSFVVEQRGVIHTFPNDPDVSAATIFLNIENRVFDGNNEMGLLGLAFHPNFVSNGFFYVNYNPNNISSRISRFQVSSSDPNVAVPDSEVVLLEFSQPYTNHNGGQLAFGPDGFLYIASGDGGSGGDPEENGQDRSTLLGAILRIDVDSNENGLNYGIPASNPFVDEEEFRDEIFAYGLRNPWRMSFDVNTGLLWAADVGQGRWEEIDIIENGNNYGWNVMEGAHCFGADNCDDTNLTLPVYEYSHDNDDLSITGGYVYRGNEVTQLQGRYVYADFISGRIWALITDLDVTLSNALLMDTDFEISSFGTDVNNELYICTFNGAIYKFEEN